MRKLFLILMTLMACSWSLSAQTRTYHGTVVDGSNNEPLIGATIMPVGGGQGVATDADGKFTLKVPANVKQAKVSYVGYATQTVAIRDNMVVKLASSDSDLDELVVLGYGSAKKLGSVVGSVAVVGEKQLENIPTATFVDALQGQVPGLNIFSNSGDPSSTDNAIRIRGVNSLNAGNTPLFILDGAPVSSSVFTTLNPNDIKSVTVLKDAASVAIYGSRAANGVIVITSKRGAFGEKANVTLRANVGWSQMVEDNVTMMNSQQYIEFRDKIGSPVSQEVRDIVDKYGISTDWRKEMFNDNALTYSVDAAVSGGGENLSYYLSLNHYDADGIITMSGMRRETLRTSLNSRVNDWLRVGLQANLGYTKYGTNSQVTNSGIYLSNPMIFARMAFPYDSPYYYTIDDDGQIHYGDRAMTMHYFGYNSPEWIYETNKSNRTNITANLNLYEQITPVKGLTIRAQQAVNAYDYRLDNKWLPYETTLTPMGDILGDDPNIGALNSGQSTQSFQRYYAWTFTNTAEYNILINDLHDVTVLLGEESMINKDDMFAVTSNGFTDRRLMLLQQGPNVDNSMLNQRVQREIFNSIFLKGSYNFDNRYFFEATYRRDGSSRFAPGHRWSNFFSVGGMWNVKQEKFLQSVEWLNELQARVSYGSTGNSSIPNYAYFGTVGTYNPGYGTGSNTTSTGLGNPSNPDLTWETVYAFDAALRFKTLGIITAEIDFYKKTTKDMLMQIPWSYTTGFDASYGNIGSMTNTGVDVNVQADIIKTQDWYWGVRCNFNYNKNKITELFSGRDSYTIPNTGLRYEVGHSAGEFYSVRYVGVDPRDGKQMWLDKNDNITKIYNEEENSVMTGKSQFAPWTGGFGTSLSWKGISLSVDFNWAAKKYMTNNDAFFLQNASQGYQQNQDVCMLNVWTKPGDVTMYPNANETPQFDSRYIEDASFLRLKNLTLSYSFPKNIVNVMRLSNLVLHFTGRNLWTVTDFTGYDPEPQTNMYKFAYPNTRQYEFGVEVSF